MRAVVCQRSRLDVRDLPEPVPAPGQAVLSVLGCGICGSDLHAREHGDSQADVLVEAGYDGFLRADQQVVLGHEFVGEVAELRGGSGKRARVGEVVVAMPLRRADGVLHAVGLSAAAPGGYAERMIVEQSLLLPVPNGLAPEIAVLTEPMAIGYHAVRRSQISGKDVAIVLGCGPVGLAVIAMLAARGVRTIVASDFSARRRELARACGAHVVVDPAQDSPWTSFGDRGHLPTVSSAVELAVSTVEKLQRLPVGWHHLWRLAERAGAASPRRPVVFECVGVPGMIDSVLTSAPLFSRVMVVGVCMQPDLIRPMMAINKEIDLRFVIGYTPLEFRDTLFLLAEGKVRTDGLVTGTVGLDGVADAFGALAEPDRHAKVVVDPRSTATLTA